jgi:hypothetical protein
VESGKWGGRRRRIDFLHKSKKKNPTPPLTFVKVSPPAGRGWGWGVRGLLEEV